MIKIRAYRAIDDPDTCIRYAQEHRKVLEGFNLANITTNNSDWAHDPYTFVVIAESEKTGNMLGGIRIKIADGINPLPVEEAVHHFDPKISEIVEHHIKNGGTAELCGLWNSREETPQMGITLMLVISGLSISNQLPINSIFTIVASYTLKIALQVGYKIEKSVGNNGEFVYPNSNFVARVLIMNPVELEHTYQNYKQRILFLRNNLLTEITEKTAKGDDILVKYDLKLNNTKF